MGAHPLISIIIPCYNAEKWIKECLNSALSQSHPRTEVIVIDDCSNDKSPEIVKSFSTRHKGIKLFSTNKNEGASSARNLGVSNSQGRFFLFLDADDLLEPHALEYLYETIQQYGTDGAVGNWINFDERTGKLIEKVNWGLYYPEDPFASWLRQPAVSSAILIRYNSLKWKTKKKINEVFDYFATLQIEGFTLAHCNHTVTRIRQHWSPNRMSIKHNHFEPLSRGLLYAKCTENLHIAGKYTLLRGEAIDQKILSYLYMLVRDKRINDAEYLAHYIDRKNLLRYSWFRFWKSSGFAYLLGVFRGIKY